MRNYLPHALISGCLTLGIAADLGQSASAATLHNGWQYAIDSGRDSLAVVNGQRTAGGTAYEIHSMAFKDDPLTNSIWVALNVNLPLYGANTGPEICITNEACYPVADSNIGWGDLFLDFSGTGSLRAASDAGRLYGIRFSPTNDSGASTVGFYENVRATSVTVENAGYTNLWSNNNMLQNRLGNAPAGMGDFAWNNPYFAPYIVQGNRDQPEDRMLTSIASGTKTGEISLLGREALLAAGFEPQFLSAPGSQVFGFRFAKSLLPGGDFIATLLTECVNDGISLVGSLVPPPPLPPPPPPRRDCPVDPGQLNAIQPNQVIDGVKYFENAASELWYDPPANMGYRLVVNGDGSITEIQGFPCLLDSSTGESTFPSPFKISVRDVDGNVKELGIQQPGSKINIVEAIGRGSKEVIITGVDPDEWQRPGDPPAFKLRFDKPNVDFLVTEIPDTTIETPPRIIQLPREPIILPPLKPTDPVIGPSPGPVNSAAVPEPTTMAGLALAAGGLFGLRRRSPKK